MFLRLESISFILHFNLLLFLMILLFVSDQLGARRFRVSDNGIRKRILTQFGLSLHRNMLYGTSTCDPL